MIDRPLINELINWSHPINRSSRITSTYLLNCWLFFCLLLFWFASLLLLTFSNMQRSSSSSSTSSSALSPFVQCTQIFILLVKFHYPWFHLHRTSAHSDLTRSSVGSETATQSIISRFQLTGLLTYLQIGSTAAEFVADIAATLTTYYLGFRAINKRRFLPQIRWLPLRTCLNPVSFASRDDRDLYRSTTRSCHCIETRDQVRRRPVAMEGRIQLALADLKINVQNDLHHSRSNDNNDFVWLSRLPRLLYLWSSFMHGGVDGGGWAELLCELWR